MNAIEYVKKNGIEKSKIHLDRMKQERWINSFFNDLKQIVDAWELVESYSGLTMAKRQYSCFANACESVGVNKSPRVLALGKAINLVEQCQ